MCQGVMGREAECSGRRMRGKATTDLVTSKGLTAASRVSQGSTSEKETLRPCAQVPPSATFRDVYKRLWKRRFG